MTRKIRTVNISKSLTDWISTKIGKNGIENRSDQIRKAMDRWLPLLLQENPTHEATITTVNLEEHQRKALDNIHCYGVQSGSELVRMCLILEQMTQKKEDLEKKKAEHQVQIIDENILRIGTKAYKIVTRRQN